MKKKLLVLAIALVLACSIIGTSLALYVVNDSKNVSISTGESITLSFGSTQTLSVNDLSPNTGKDSVSYEITLTSTGTGSVAGMAGFFRIVIEDVSAGNLSEALNVSGVAEKEGEEDIALSSSDIKDGKAFLLSNLPYTITVTFALTSEAKANFIDYADESVSITVYWVPFDNSAFYLRRASENWLPNKDNILVAHEGSEVKILNVAMLANEEFKFSQNGNWWGTPQEANGNLAISLENGNLKVEDAGEYDFYFNYSNHTVWAELSNVEP